MKISLERQIPLVFVSAIVLLAVIIFFAFRSMNSTNQALDWQKHTQAVLLQLDQVLILMINAETSARGFLVTRDETALDQYNQARRDGPAEFERLRLLIVDNESQTANFGRLSKAVAERLDFLGAVIENRRAAPLDETLARANQARGRELSNAVRQIIGEMKAEEEALLARRENDLNRSLATSYVMLFVVGFAGLASLGVANLAIYREIGKRRKAEDDLRAANRDLESHVADRTRELVTKNAELGAEMTRREQAESVREEVLKKEQSARRDAEAANRLRDEFLATVSHELRAPLNAILGWGRLMEKGILDEQSMRRAVETIIRNADAQNRLIEDLLDVSRIISGKLRLEIATIDPLAIVEAAMENARPAAEAKGIALELEARTRIGQIQGDPNRLQQIVWNLLSNAVKFTPEGGRVQVEVEAAGDAIELRVSDSGIGISADFLPHVFDRFRQADASTIRRFGGLGLGLAIVRHLVEMHGGSVSAASAGENRGATFVVRLPLAAPRAAGAETHVAEAVGRVLPNAAPEIRLDGLRVLVVDDEEDARVLLVNALTICGARVATARSAEEGLRKLSEECPDVLVSDIGMPGEDGYSLIRKVRALGDERLRKIPAIALTAFTRAQDRMRAIGAGFQNHLAKPVEPDELATVIASLTGRLPDEDE